MSRESAYLVSALLLATALQPAAVSAQQPQIPTLQVCNPTRVQASGTVRLARRTAGHAGVFDVHMELGCDPAGQPYPAGGGDLRLDLSDAVSGTIKLTTFEQVTTTGRETPTAYLNGRCEAEGVQGCRFWLMLADNGKPGEETPDIVGFLLFDGTGKRVGYGTGPVLPESGDVNVAPTPF